jgi:hypothetical protein
MKLICELVEDFKIITEEKENGKKNYYIEGVFLQAEIKNRNGRMYPKEMLQREVARYNAEYVDKNRAMGELNHPDGPTINLDRVSHLITSLKEDGNNYVGKAKILDTPHGNIAKSLLAEGVKLGVSSRGMGSLRTEGMDVQIVQDDFYLATAADIVADPSAPDAFVNGIMEGKEWVWQNGILVEKQVAEYKKQLDSLSRKERKAYSIKAFEHFLKILSHKI